MGLTNRFQPYCRLAIITMQMMPMMSWKTLPLRPALLDAGICLESIGIWTSKYDYLWLPATLQPFACSDCFVIRYADERLWNTTKWQRRRTIKGQSNVKHLSQQHSS